jgi:hypothetical protein
MSKNKALLIGVALFMPMFLMNLFAVMDIPTFDNMFRHVFSVDGFTLNPYGTLTIFILLLLVPIGGVITLMPMFQQRKIFLLNLLVGLFMISVFAMFVYGMGHDMYKCDILKIPNCD